MSRRGRSVSRRPRPDAAGKFRLKGFRKGTVYVVAERDGYRFAGLKTTSGAADAVVKIVRQEIPATPLFQLRHSS